MKKFFIVLLALALIFLVIGNFYCFRSLKKLDNELQSKILSMENSLFVVEQKFANSQEEHDYIYNEIESMCSSFNTRINDIKNLISENDPPKTIIVSEPKKDNKEMDLLKNELIQLKNSIGVISEQIYLLDDAVKKNAAKTSNEINLLGQKIDSLTEYTKNAVSELKTMVIILKDEVKRLDSEIKRLDSENRLIHYNYDAVLKIEKNKQNQ